MSTEHKCNCELCDLHKIRLEALESDNIEVVKKALIKFSDLWLFSDFDRCYYKCILDGSWGTAEEILTKSLKKAKQIKLEKEEDGSCKTKR